MYCTAVFGPHAVAVQTHHPEHANASEPGTGESAMGTVPWWLAGNGAQVTPSSYLVGARSILFTQECSRCFVRRPYWIVVQALSSSCEQQPGLEAAEIVLSSPSLCFAVGCITILWAHVCGNAFGRSRVWLRSIVFYATDAHETVNFVLCPSLLP